MPKYKILVVDDDKYFLLLTKEVLEDAGFEVLTAEDPEEGVKIFYDKKPDAVVMDVVMPKEFGTEVCKDLKQTEQGKNTPIILMSSGVKEMTEGDGLNEYMADGFILKPYDNGVFLDIVKRQLDNIKAEPISTAEKTQKEMPAQSMDMDIEQALLEDEPKPSSVSSTKPKTQGFRNFDSSSEPEKSLSISQGAGGLNVSIKFGPKIRELFTGNSMININNGGFFVPTNQPAALGTKVSVKVWHPTETFELKAMVVWVQPRSASQGEGMGIRFQNQKSEDLAKLKRFVLEMTS